MRSKKSFIIFLSIFTLLCSNVFGQGIDDITSKILNKGVAAESVQSGAVASPDMSVQSKAVLAMNTDGYLVTAGDVYSLNFLAGNNPVSINIIVDSSYKVRIANLAVLNVENLTFKSFKKSVEEIVTKNYPMSGVQLYLVAPGSFNVVVKGEVKSAVEVPAWALTRLSSIVNQYKNNFASIRNVKITSKNGRTRTYDLFKVQRFGDFSQDPYLRPGDVITLSPVQRQVDIKGAVKRPGSYELLEGENLKELVEVYGNGLIPTADTSRIEVTKIIGAKNKTGEKIYLSSVDKKYKLDNYDTVYVPTFADLKPIVFVEGAIKLPEEIAAENNGLLQADSKAAQTKDLKESKRTSVRFDEGLSYISFIRNHEEWFSSTQADLESAFIIRNNKRININIRKVLYDNSYKSDLIVEGDDILSVPFKRDYVVVVTGEVNRRGENAIDALTRLSSIVSQVSTPFSSQRNVTVESIDGEVKVCDLFKASRDGDLSNDPYLRPGDVITLGRVERKVTIQGAVERPGSYELLPGENLEALIKIYGHGLTPLADTSRIEVTKALNSSSTAGEKVYLKNIDKGYKLSNYDVVKVPSLSELKPIIFVEGAVAGATVDSKRIPVSFDPGLNYASFVRNHEEWFTSTRSDIDNAYVVRGKERLSINLRQIIFDKSFYSELNVEPKDILVVPFKQAYAVIVDGEVKSCGEVPMDSMSRLSSIMDIISTPYSSRRNVKVVSTDGDVHICDLFKATRNGDLDNNPYLKPGDIITVGRIDRRVEIRGAVERPGVYELLPEDDFEQLIFTYGHGLTETADLKRVQVTSSMIEGSQIGGVYYYSDIDAGYKLRNKDVVLIPDSVDLRPVIFVEGAVGTGNSDTELEGSNRISYRFNEGENYAQFVRNHEEYLSNKSDVNRAYVIRNGEKLPLDMSRILYDTAYRSDLVLEPYDILVIPFRQLYVNVAGSVYKPGRYPYIPDRTYEYYIGLAGGFNQTQNSGKAVSIVDIDGNMLKKDDIITPETTITAKTNSFTYYFNQYAPIISTTLGIVSTTLSLIFLINNK